MKTSKIDLRPKYKWSDLNDDLQNFFITKGIISAALLILGIVLLFIIKVKAVILMYFAVTAGYVLWRAFYLLSALYGQVSYYIGTVEMHKGKDYTPKNPITKKPIDYRIFGKSSVLMAISKTEADGTETIAKFEVPVGYSFNVSEGNKLIVYAKKNSVFQKNSNTFMITNPILVKVYAE